MKIHIIPRVTVPALALISWLLPQSAHCFCNPSTGRWLNRDRVGEQGGENLHAYVGNNGLCAVDPLGLATLRFEVVTGIWVGYAGTWSQPFWAGDGDYLITDSSAWSQVTLNNNASFWDTFHYSADYCNTVEVAGGSKRPFEHAGAIRVYLKDCSPGTFHITGLYTASLVGAGPDPVYAQTWLYSASGAILSYQVATHKSPITSALAAISEDVTLRANEEKLVVQYVPYLDLKNRDNFGGRTSSVAVSATIDIFGVTSSR